MEVQAVLFVKSRYNEASSKSWLKHHNFVPIKKADITTNFIRWRIREPQRGATYAVKKITPSINLVLMKT